MQTERDNLGIVQPGLPRGIITFASLLHILLKETSVRGRDIIALGI